MRGRFGHARKLAGVPRTSVARMKGARRLHGASAANRSIRHGASETRPRRLLVSHVGNQAPPSAQRPAQDGLVIYSRQKRGGDKNREGRGGVITSALNGSLSSCLNSAAESSRASGTMDRL